MNKIRFGFKNVYYSLITETTSGVTFSEPKRWVGGRSISLSPQGDTNSFYADDTVLTTSTSNNGYTGTLTMANADDDFKKEVLGYVESANGGLIEDANATPKPFALLFECQGDESATRYCYFKTVPGRMGMDANTKEDSVSPDTLALSVTVAPIQDGDNAWVHMEIPKGASGYDQFFDSVTMPSKKTTV